MKGFSDAGAWVVVMMMWVAAFGGIMKVMDAFKPVSDLVGKIFKCKTAYVLECNSFNIWKYGT